MNIDIPVLARFGGGGRGPLPGPGPLRGFGGSPLGPSSSAGLLSLGRGDDEDPDAEATG